MKNKVLKVAVIVLLIMAMTMSDFILVGINIAHAIENLNNSTNHENVKFAAYFKTEEEKQVSQKEYQIDDAGMKLYMQIAVKNEGYFDGVITLENSNFKLKQNILSDAISTIEGNTITLNRVRAGNTIEIELGIEPIMAESYGVDMLSKESTLKLTGKYFDSTEKTINISSDKKVALVLLAPSELEMSMESNVITNRVYQIGEDSKKIVQIELNSSIAKNPYPIKATTFEVDIPEGVEKAEVISKGTYATNGEADRILQGYTLENNTLTITIQNTVKDGKISWKKDVTDNLILTLTLNEEAKTAEKYSVKAKVEFLGIEEEEITTESEYTLTQEVDGLIRASIENSETIYKGKIYSKESREYNSTTNIEVNYANIVEKSTFTESTGYRLEKESENLATNIEYKTTTISKAEIQKILGAQGKLTIKDQNGNIVQEITTNSQEDENGNIVINYAEDIKGITVEITKAESTGIIRLNHTKVMKAENYSREEINTFKYLTEEVAVKYGEVSYNFTKIKQLHETKTVAVATVDKQNLSTAAVNEQVKIAVTLKTDSEQYDLYKNPTLKVKLPDDVINVSNIKAVPLYLDNFVINTTYNQETREITIKLTGEQEKYNVDNTNGYIEILADIELDETIPSRKDQITLQYTNDKATVCENNGEIVLPINISGFSGLVAFNKITNYNLKTNSVNSLEEQIGSLKMYQNEAQANFEIALVNNTSTDLENVLVIGNLPVQGNITIGDYTFENTVAATLKSGINVQTGLATIYYTNNSKATADLQNPENAWSTNLSEVSNPVLYMLVIPQMEKETNFIANYTMNIPANLEYDKDMRTTYVAYYETSISDVKVKAKPVGLETGKVLVTLEATVGTDSLKNDAVVKAGEVIRYKVTATNTGSNPATNIKISALVPEGTVLVEPIIRTEDSDDEVILDGFEHAGERYYEELQGTIAEKTIELLESKQTKAFEYEVRVKNEIIRDTIENQATITYGEGIEVKSNVLINKLEEGNIRVTVKRVAYVSNLVPGEIAQYFVIVENISNVQQDKINIKFNIPEEIMKMTYIEELEAEKLELKNEWIVDSIPANQYRIYNLFLKVDKIKNIEIKADLNAVATQKDIKYRSNIYAEVLNGFDIEMNMSSPNEGEYLKTDDLIEYEIEIRNNSIVQIGVMFEEKLPEQLSILKMEVNGKELQTNLSDSSIYKYFDLKASSTITIKIYTIVNYDRGRLENETITNIARVLYAGEELATTQSVSHIIESIVLKDEDTKPEEPENPDEPDDPDDPDNPDEPEEIEKKKFNISGKAWVDQNKDGEMNDKDTLLESIKVKLLNIDTNEFVRNDDNSKDLIIETNQEGYYEFEKIIEGNYIVVFEYDKTLYKPTTYQKEGVLESKNSNVVSKTLTVNGEEKEYAATNDLTLNQNISNINMGLVFIKKFDVELDKYVSKVIVQTSKDTTTYDYQDKDFAKVDINAKRMVGSTILVQYTIKVTNIGDVDAYVNSIVDYLPAGFKFSSELNTQWYEQGTDLYTNCLESTAIAPGESREVNLILTKTKTDENAELINNMAEVHDTYNIYGIADLNSEVGNKNKEENDFGSADLMISIQTGTVFNYIALVISMLGVIGVAAYLINKKILGINI